MRMVNIKKIILWLLLLEVFAASAPAAVPAPVLKWKNGGFAYDDFNKGMYGSPALLDVNQDGIGDIVWSSFKVFAFDGATGAVIWSFWAGNDRSSVNDYHGIGTDTNIAVADIDGDGLGEIITAHTNGLLCVYDRNGHFLAGFPQRPLGRSDPIESLSVFDLDRDGHGEIIIGWANPNNLNVCVIGHDGAIKPGWPQHVLNPNANALGVWRAGRPLRHGQGLRLLPRRPPHPDQQAGLSNRLDDDLARRGELRELRAREAGLVPGRAFLHVHRLPGGDRRCRRRRLDRDHHHGRGVHLSRRTPHRR